MTCTKPYSITIAPAVISCPDWSTLLWDVPNIIGTSPPDATGSMSPSGVAGDIFTMQSAVGQFPPDPWLVQGSNSGQLTYNGTGCNCNLELNFSGAFTDPMEISCSIQITQDGNPVLGIPGTLGVVNHPFTLNDTSGNPVVIQVTITLQCHNLIGGGPCSMNVIGTLSNV